MNYVINPYQIRPFLYNSVYSYRLNEILNELRNLDIVLSVNQIQRPFSINIIYKKGTLEEEARSITTTTLINKIRGIIVELENQIIEEIKRIFLVYDVSDVHDPKNFYNHILENVYSLFILNIFRIKEDEIEGVVIL